MSDHSHDITPPSPETFDAKHAGSLPTVLLFAGVLGIAGSARIKFFSRFSHWTLQHYSNFQ